VPSSAYKANLEVMYEVMYVWPAAGSVDTDLGSLSLLELYRTDLPQR